MTEACHIEPRIYELIPHREPMLLIHRVTELGNNVSCTEIDITKDSSFFIQGKGVPSWIGVEYMGQTAALIAGYQLEQGTVAPHLGLLLGTRKYEAFVPYFQEGDQLQVRCTEIAVVGDSLANFQCDIFNLRDNSRCASAKLSVFRKPLQEDAQPNTLATGADA
ncbi:ApeP family dehydratase [Cellvibrio fontiphilus]|uniref:3-hydroxylacyl-ACP dehydratase n=1 Tax=Cellvibrio fontiphilus TaxID=1815559 RepID=A0ABV7FDU0_9GAMM